MAQYESTAQQALAQIRSVQDKLDGANKELADIKSRSVSKVCNELGTKTDMLVIFLLIVAVVLAAIAFMKQSKCDKLERILISKGISVSE